MINFTQGQPKKQKFATKKAVTSVECANTTRQQLGNASTIT